MERWRGTLEEEGDGDVVGAEGAGDHGEGEEEELCEYGTGG